MKFKLYFLCLIGFSIFFFSCEKKTVSSPFSSDSLVSQEFTIALDRDTVLTTSKGAIIRIPKGAIQSKNKTQVKLLLKEAYDLESMILGGLSTKSDSGMLSSAGMFFLSCKDSSDYTFAKPIEFSIPTVSVNPDMQLYEGEVKPDGSIVWKNEKPIPKDSASMAALNGKELFEANCLACHEIGKEKVGPDLAYIGENRNKDWLYRFTRNSQKMIKVDKDPWGMQLYCEYNNTEMTSFPELTDAELAALYAYIYQYSYQNKLPIPNKEECRRLCRIYNERMKKLQERRDELQGYQNKFSPKIDPNTQYLNRTSSQFISSAITSGTALAIADSNESKFLNYNPRFYKVEVQAFGWYNIDMIVKKFPDVKPASLKINFTNTSVENSLSYLLIPDYNVVMQSMLLKDGKIGFDYTSDGSTTLPIGKNALIISTKEDKDGVWFSTLSFIIQEKNEFSITLEKTTLKEANKKIKDLQLKDFSYQIKESIYRNENIRNEIKEAKISDKLEDVNQAIMQLEHEKPKGCNCACGNTFISEVDSLE
jgi:mono/diheme cytochrome c family protein